MGKTEEMRVFPKKQKIASATLIQFSIITQISGANEYVESRITPSFTFIIQILISLKTYQFYYMVARLGWQLLACHKNSKFLLIDGPKNVMVSAGWIPLVMGICGKQPTRGKYRKKFNCVSGVGWHTLRKGSSSAARLHSKWNPQGLRRAGRPKQCKFLHANLN